MMKEEAEFESLLEPLSLPGKPAGAVPGRKLRKGSGANTSQCWWLISPEVRPLLSPNTIDKDPETLTLTGYGATLP